MWICSYFILNLSNNNFNFLHFLHSSYYRFFKSRTYILLISIYVFNFDRRYIFIMQWLLVDLRENINLTKLKKISIFSISYRFFESYTSLFTFSNFDWWYIFIAILLQYRFWENVAKFKEMSNHRRDENRGMIVFFYKNLLQFLCYNLSIIK